MKFRLFLFLCLSTLIWWHSTSATAIADGPAALPTDVVPQQITIPAIGLDSTIVSVGLETVEVKGQTYPIWETAENEIGWHRGSGPPGHPGNTVLAGHSNGASEIFRHLEAVEIGDEILLDTTMGTHRYQVTDKFILREQGEPVEVRVANAQWILPTADERLTLITCWPYPSSTHRLLVIAHPVSLESHSTPPPVLDLDPHPELDTPSLQSNPIFTANPNPVLQRQPHPDHFLPGLEPAPSTTPTYPLPQSRSRVALNTITANIDLSYAYWLNDLKR